MRIVIVEDETPIREGMAKILSKINAAYEVVGTAADGQAGYELILKEKPDLIIMDIQMPKMDGLTMLKKLRDEQITSKAIVLSAYSDFSYAKQAIELGTGNYLLKPIKIPELRKVLKQAEEELRKEQSMDQAFSLDTILVGCIHGQIQPEEQLNETIQEKYGITLDDPAELLLIWLGDGYEEQKKITHDLLERVGAHTMEYDTRVLEADSWHALLMVLYRLPRKGNRYNYYQKSVLPMLQSNLQAPVLGVWGKADRLLDLVDVVPRMRDELEWNLTLGAETLLSQDVIEKKEIVPLKYPSELEDRAKRAMVKKDRVELTHCFEQLGDHIMGDVHQPSEIKETILRFCWNVEQAQEGKSGEEEQTPQSLVQSLRDVNTWQEVERYITHFLADLNFELSDESEGVSEMVQKARDMIKRYYDQGITLEEIADKLFVTEEYLSAQFKKETGVTFTETVRKYRIEKVKELLLNTHLKLNQIADLAGYSDPKYMSKVFKEEVGMLPNEYRKSSH